MSESLSASNSESLSESAVRTLPNTNTGENTAAIDAADSQRSLPDTGDQNQSNLGLLGLAAMAGDLFAAKRRKKKGDNEASEVEETE